MSWLMNADYESFLFSGKTHYKGTSNKINQEFEYLIHFIEDEAIYTTKSYSSQFIQHLESISSKKFKTTSDNSNVQNWWCSVNELSKDRILHSKITSTNLAIELDLEKEAKLVCDDFIPVDGHLYKMPGELSGRGHLIYPKDRTRIEKLIRENQTLIEEPIRDRVIDFSTLVLSSDKYLVYENIVDQKFQYKGTRLIEPRIELGAKYFDVIEKTIQHYGKLGASYPYSIDSYAYRRGESVEVAAICEVNPRKTMGYIAYRLKEFFNSEYASMLILPKRTRNVEGAKWLSPQENRFQIVYLSAKTSDELLHLEAEVLKP
ncbi:MAG: hypothetical protein KC478_07480 [Bacteriovoracaceae bacterium]|nr:hypothetical protein [Bacteriovoracaceae bacterium]